MSTSKTAQPKNEALQEVTLAKPHKHAGKPCKAGDKINVNAGQLKFLKDRKIIK
jgi:hypothetical protein